MPQTHKQNDWNTSNIAREREQLTFDDDIKHLLLKGHDDIEEAISGVVLPPLWRVLDAKVSLKHRQYPIALVPVSGREIEDRRRFVEEGESRGREHTNRGLCGGGRRTCTCRGCQSRRRWVPAEMGREA